MILIERAVVGRADAAHDLAVAHGHEEIGDGVLKEGVLLSIERQVGIAEERRDELRTILVQIIVELHKSLDLSFVVGIHLLDAEHALPPREIVQPIHHYITTPPARATTGLCSASVRMPLHEAAGFRVSFAECLSVERGLDRLKAGLPAGILVPVDGDHRQPPGRLRDPIPEPVPDLAARRARRPGRIDRGALWRWLLCGTVGWR